MVDGGGGRIYVEESDQECDCGCGGGRVRLFQQIFFIISSCPFRKVETEEEETEFGPDRAEMEMLL